MLWVRNGIGVKFVLSAQPLDRNSWNVSQTAKVIGVSREGLHRMIKKYDLMKPDDV